MADELTKQKNDDLIEEERKMKKRNELSEMNQKQIYEYRL